MVKLARPLALISDRVESLIDLWRGRSVLATVQVVLPWHSACGCCDLPLTRADTIVGGRPDSALVVRPSSKTAPCGCVVSESSLATLSGLVLSLMRPAKYPSAWRCRLWETFASCPIRKSSAASTGIRFKLAPIALPATVSIGCGRNDHTASHHGMADTRATFIGGRSRCGICWSAC